MAMSRKHYREVAGLIAAERALARSLLSNATPGGNVETYGVAVLESTRNLAMSLADMFKRDNGAFQREKFYEAAGISAPHLSKGEER